MSARTKIYLGNSGTTRIDAIDKILYEPVLNAGHTITRGFWRQTAPPTPLNHVPEWQHNA